MTNTIMTENKRKTCFKMIGHGVYTIAEAARYTQLEPGKVRRWFKGQASQHLKPVCRSDYERVNNDFALSFYDLIDLLVVAEFRKNNVSLPHIRKVYKALRERFGKDHPFCFEQLFVDGRRIIVEVKDVIGKPLLIEPVTLQTLYSQFKSFLKRIDFDSTQQMAERWRISRGVIIDPQIRFGKPVAESTGVTTFILAMQYEANHQDASLVSHLYGVTEQNVLDAVEFETYYGLRRAA